MQWSSAKQHCTLHSELGLGIDSAVVNAVVGHAGVESCIFLCEVGDQQAATGHHLETTPTKKDESRQRLK